MMVIFDLSWVRFMLRIDTSSIKISPAAGSTMRKSARVNELLPENNKDNYNQTDNLLDLYFKKSKIMINFTSIFDKGAKSNNYCTCRSPSYYAAF